MNMKNKQAIVGFVGRVELSLPEDTFNEKLAKNLNALLKFARYSNVDGGRTVGLGMLEYKNSVES